MTTIQIPATFYDDHVGRDLPGGTLVHYRGNIATIEVDHATFLDLLGDAKLYAEFSDDDYRDNRSICDSATRAYARLLKLEAPEANHLGACPTCREDVYDDTAVCAYCGTPCLTTAGQAARLCGMPTGDFLDAVMPTLT